MSILDKKETNQPVKTKTTLFYGYIIVAIIFVLQFIMFGSNSSSGVFFKPVINEFGWSRALMSGAFSFSRISAGVAGILMGGLNDRFGPRIVITICGFLVGGGFLLMSLTHNLWQLYIFYVVILGIGMSGVFAPQMSTVAKWFTQRRNLMTGIVFIGGSLGAIIIPPVTNWLISVYDWRNAFIIIGAVCLVVIVSLSQFLKRSPHQMGQMPYGESREPGVSQPQTKSNTAGLSLKQAAHTSQFWIVNIMAFCCQFCLATIMVHIVPHATDLGISSAAAANILAILSVGLLIGCFAAGFAADRIGTRKTYIACFIPVLMVLLLLLPVTQAWLLGLFVLVMAAGAGGSATLVSPMFAELFGVKSHGLILGVSYLVGTFGGAVGPFIAGYIFDVSGGYQGAFILCGILIVIALAIALFLKPITKPVTKPVP